MMGRIITIGRELGGSLAKNLGIAYYEQEIIAEVANRTELFENN